MINDVLKNEFVELLATNFKPEEINEIGRFLVDKKYDHYILSGTERHITISSRKAALILCDTIGSDRNGGLLRLIQFVTGLDGKLFLNRTVELQRLESFLTSMTRYGYQYDYKTGKIVPASKDTARLKNWGALRDDKTYDCTVMSIDIVRNSELVRTHGQKLMEKLYFKFTSFLDHLMEHYDGRIWNWAGDGGLLALTFKGHETRAVLCALDIQRSLIVFQLSPEYPLPEDFALRIGLDSGKVKFNMDTGKIVSDVINYAAHLEKQWAKPGCVAISDTVFEALPPKLRTAFPQKDTFEGRTCYSTVVIY
ncbi:MAG: adenylate/guanylate cyclase domain-containing protein [Spirochaetes bacterium]|nr:adenylate/guanylate cyclase domain-containing protein [Spirochaetota bacterium]